MSHKQENIVPIFNQMLSKKDKELRLNQKAVCIWFTGLSGSGKSTIAVELEKELFKKGFLTKLIDGDNVRTGINSNLSFSEADRNENIRRIAEVNKLFNEAGIITLSSFISPTNLQRKMAEDIIGKENFYLIHVSTSLETCEERDIKGLYKKARKGEISDFTGISSPFEIPESSFITIDTKNISIEQSVLLISNKILPIITLK